MKYLYLLLLIPLFVIGQTIDEPVIQDPIIDTPIVETPIVDSPIVDSPISTSSPISEKILYTKGNIDIEVLDINPTLLGVQALVKAWRDDSQLAFSPSGQVEIERVNIINPPELVPDPLGSVIRTYKDKQGVTRTLRYRNDPQEAILITLADTVQEIGKPNTYMVEGKIGNTTTVIYSDAGDNVLRADDASWATLRAKTDAEDERQTNTSTYLADGYNGSVYEIFTPFIMFDTSTIPATDTISSATISLWFIENNANGTTDKLYAVQSKQATWNDPVLADYDQRQSTSFGSLVLPATAVTTDAYYDITLNASGIANIARSGETIPVGASASGKSQFALRGNDDFDNTTPTTQAGAALIAFADTTGTTNDPKLTVQHAAASGTSTATSTTATTSQAIQPETYATILFVSAVSLVMYVLIFAIKRIKATRGRV